MAKKPAAPADAKKALQGFVDASIRRDLEEMKSFLSKSTLESGQFNGSAGPEGVKYVLGEPRPEKDGILILLRAFPEGTPEAGEPVMQMDCLMIREKGSWKFDLAASVERMMGGALEQVVSTMAEVVEGVGKAMGEGLQAAFGESDAEKSAPEASWDEAPLTPSAEELKPLPKMRPLPKTQAAVSKAVGSKVIVQAAMEELLMRAGSNEEDVLINWFEDSLFAGWAALLRPLGLKGRLRAIRIEAATHPSHRLLGIDGSDLVYRMNLPHDSGFFQDDQVAALLPGVLAGLPENIDPAVAGHRLLPLDEERIDFALYRQAILPRAMRRIRARVGRPVDLEAEWETIEACDDAGRLLSMWGLNRILGGIALAGAEKTRGLSRIRLVLEYDIEKARARFENGTLELTLRPYSASDAACYEHEIAEVLAAGTKPAKKASPKKRR